MRQMTITLVILKRMLTRSVGTGRATVRRTEVTQENMQVLLHMIPAVFRNITRHGE